MMIKKIKVPIAEITTLKVRNLTIKCSRRTDYNRQPFKFISRNQLEHIRGHNFKKWVLTVDIMTSSTLVRETERRL